MPGKKGMKWKKPKSNRIPTSITLDPKTLKKLQRLAKEKRWHISTTINFIIEVYLKEAQDEDN